MDGKSVWRSQYLWGVKVFALTPKRKNFFKKGVDKIKIVCYNKDTEREVDNYEKQKAAKPNRQGNGWTLQAPRNATRRWTHILLWQTRTGSGSNSTDDKRKH